MENMTYDQTLDIENKWFKMSKYDDNYGGDYKLTNT